LVVEKEYPEEDTRQIESNCQWMVQQEIETVSAHRTFGALRRRRLIFDLRSPVE